jgi:8-oxo-dGTP pyrophosphatase MutT (NUDIX family)
MLVKRGLVGRSHQDYRLSTVGAEFLMEGNPTNGAGQTQHIKLAAMCVPLRTSPTGLRVLGQTRNRSPFAGQQNFIGGGLLRGEPATAAAIRRLRQEAGLIAATSSLLGLVRKQYYDRSGRLYGDILFHVCSLQDVSGRLQRHNQFGDQNWRSLSEIIALERTAPQGSPQLATWLEGWAGSSSVFGRELFYFTEEYHQDIT